MKAEFRRPGEAPDGQPVVVATATWDGHNVQIQADDAEVRTALERAYRRTPVVTDDASARRLGTNGSVLIEPSGLEWVRAVTQVRVPAETGLEPVFVVEAIEGGYDPAANYRTFEAQIDRLSVRTDPSREG
jgi:hypothetical protein